MKTSGYDDNGPGVLDGPDLFVEHPVTTERGLIELNRGRKAGPKIRIIHEPEITLGIFLVFGKGLMRQLKTREILKNEKFRVMIRRPEISRCAREAPRHSGQEPVEFIKKSAPPDLGKGLGMAKKPLEFRSHFKPLPARFTEVNKIAEHLGGTCLTGEELLVHDEKTGLLTDIHRPAVFLFEFGRDRLHERLERFLTPRPLITERLDQLRDLGEIRLDLCRSGISLNRHDKVQQ
ncbi:MAG: hypothetical protein BWY49_00453 [Candidatus Omnitrophica bacterium ADurb.Bin314]|nr:MAG: hypothetical protein BWY49_00453 [Candidatus Omnitrophica bacterium ADurb.Bin314]